MVKYGPSVDSTPAEKLAKFAHEDSQDGAQQGKERCATSVPPDRRWTKGESDRLDPLALICWHIPCPLCDQTQKRVAPVHREESRRCCRL